MKFKILDECGGVFPVKPAEKTADAEPTAEPATETEHEFTAEEMKLLRKLLKHAETIADICEAEERALTPANKQHSKAAAELGADEEFYNELSKIEAEGAKEAREEAAEDDGAEDTDEDEGTSTKDSRKSFGSIENRRHINDSEIDREADINAAWAKYYGGK